MSPDFRDFMCSKRHVLAAFMSTMTLTTMFVSRNTVSNLRQSRRLEIGNRSKRLRSGGHLKVAYLLKHVQLIEPAVFLFLLLDVFPDHCLISANC